MYTTVKKEILDPHEVYLNNISLSGESRDSIDLENNTEEFLTYAINIYQFLFLF